MRRSEDEGRCKRHPEHRICKGVCPYCLRERLSHISASSSSTTTMNTSSTTSSPYSSNSELPSPTTSSLLKDPKETATTATARLSEGLRKSRSLAFVIKEEEEKEGKKMMEENMDRDKKSNKNKNKDKKSKNKKKVGRFLSKLIVGSERRRKQVDGDQLFHSKTMKEKPSSKWVWF
ncbi:hypothetical protein ACMD2_02684 [Ananas comosus]|uniref:Uncharacterized protein n=1 Tax=Ananas comosus TaxID=4615 RepID=A0A199VMU5_ANACO|nr:hypothetical protein ACMD2_02684 [Ananas comosus]